MKDKIVKLIATFFFVGYLPLIPGTWGSLAGVAVYLLVKDNIYVFLGVFAILFFLGIYAAGKAEDIFGKKDEKRIVIDEVCSILLLFLLIHPWRLYTPYLITGFIVLRLFDFLKPYPARRMEKLPGGLGIMGDDVVAALYSYVFISALACFGRYLP